MSSSALFVALPASAGEPPTRVDHKEYDTKSEDSGMEVDHGSYRDRLLAEKRYKFVEKMIPEVGDIRIDRDKNGPFMVILDKLNHFMDQQMEKALIVKLIGRTMGHQMLH
ncbi:hypothetical protein Sjap_015984 [Stephania japonica]|uniref:Uncharacterized protein n=1 Tax=Stephania japonica TaxID=461633 RepID=A0AAP0NRE2_9MAGN